MLPEPNWPSSKQEAYRYTNLAAANALPLGAGVISSVFSHPRGSGSDDILTLTSDTYTLTHLIPAARSARALSLTIARGAEVMLEEILSSSAGTGAAQQDLAIIVQEGARLTHLRRQQLDMGCHHWGQTQVQIERDASYQHFALHTGAALARHDLEVTLAAAGGSVQIQILQLLSASQHGDITTRVEHAAAHTQSSQLIKSILAGQARGVYQGQIRVAPHAQKSNGQQQSRALLLSPQAEMNTKPELEIFADDVQCSHGAAIGALDEQALFYLRTRGLPLAQARAMLLDAFTQDVFAQITHTQLRERWQQEGAQWLQQHA